VTATKSGESDPENTESTSKRGKPTMVSSVFHGAEPCIRARSLGRVRDPVRIAEGPTHDFGFSILDFGLRTEATRVSLPEAPARGEGLLVDSARALPLSGTWETWMAPNVTNQPDFQVPLDCPGDSGGIEQMPPGMTRLALLNGGIAPR
jgi:hypothetical protein